MVNFVVEVIQSTEWIDYAVAVGALASACVAFAAAVIAARSWRGARQKHAQSIVERLTSADVSRARNVVGTYARGTKIPGPGEERDDLREAAFVMMWALERAALHRSQARETTIVNAESQVIYDHMDAMVSDLDMMFDKYDSLEEFTETAIRINASLAVLPPLKSKRANKLARKAWFGVPIKDPPKNRLRFALPAGKGDGVDEEKGVSNRTQWWYQGARWFFPIVAASSSSIAAPPLDEISWTTLLPTVTYIVLLIIPYGIMVGIKVWNRNKTDTNKLARVATLMSVAALVPLVPLWALDPFDEPAVKLNLIQLSGGIFIGVLVAGIGHYLPTLKTAETHNYYPQNGSVKLGSFGQFFRTVFFLWISYFVTRGLSSLVGKINRYHQKND